MEIIDNILITSAGRRVSLVRAFQKELRLLNLQSRVFCADLMPKLSSACEVSDQSFKVSRVTSKGYIDELLNICLNNNTKVIIPTIDTELKVLSENRELFSKKGIQIVVSDLQLVLKCRNKRQIHSFFDEIRFNRAQEFEKNNIVYPAFVKPIDGSRSIGTYLLNSELDLTEGLLDNPKNMFLEYFSPLEYNEFTVDIYFNKQSKIISIVPRQRIFVRDGEVNKACTRKNEIVSFVKEKFKDIIGFRGCVTLQVFKHKKQNKIIGIEINPRFGGGYPLSYLSGANFPRWIIQEYILEEDVNEYFQDWENNLLMLRYDAEILSHEYKG